MHCRTLYQCQDRTIRWSIRTLIFVTKCAFASNCVRSSMDSGIPSSSQKLMAPSAATSPFGRRRNQSSPARQPHSSPEHDSALVFLPQKTHSSAQEIPRFCFLVCCCSGCRLRRQKTHLRQWLWWAQPPARSGVKEQESGTRPRSTPYSAGRYLAAGAAYT